MSRSGAAGTVTRRTSPPPLVTVPAGQPVPTPPDGHAWVFLADRRGTLTLIARPVVGHDPVAPPGHTWRLVKVRGGLVYVAQPHPFLSGGFGSDWDDAVHLWLALLTR